jgi:hypothetical protein
MRTALDDKVSSLVTYLHVCKLSATRCTFMLEVNYICRSDRVYAMEY